MHISPNQTNTVFSKIDILFKQYIISLILLPFLLLNNPTSQQLAHRLDNNHNHHNLFRMMFNNQGNPKNLILSLHPHSHHHIYQAQQVWIYYRLLLQALTFLEYYSNYLQTLYSNPLKMKYLFINYIIAKKQHNLNQIMRLCY